MQSNKDRIPAAPSTSSETKNTVVMLSAVFLHGIDEAIFLSAIHDSFCDSAGLDDIICEKQSPRNKENPFIFDIIPLVNRAYNVVDNGSRHLRPPLFFMSFLISSKLDFETVPHSRKEATASLIMRKLSSVPFPSGT